MIVKIQRPLMTNGSDPKALIYNQDKTYQAMPDLDSVIGLFGPDENKIYHHAEVRENLLYIGHKTKTQIW